MCRCCGWGRKEDQRSLLMAQSIESRTEELAQVDTIDNDRMLWRKGVAIEVFSETIKDWFPGKIIEIGDDSAGRVVKVVYNGTTKWVPVFSRKLRPLVTEFSGVRTKSFNEAYSEAKKLLDEHNPELEPVVLDAFISYSQGDSQDAAALLSLLLKSRGIETWFDQQQDNLNTSNMSKGISRSCCFIIFLTKSYFRRKFTVFELETALALEKTIIIIWEGEDRHGGFSNFKSYMNACPEKYKSILFEEEALKFERRKQLQEAQLNIIADRISQAHQNQVRVK